MIRRIVALLLLAGAAFAQPPASAQLDSIFAPLARGKSPGLAVLVRKDGRTVFQRGYGVGDLRTLRRIDAVTDFRLASFTKQFTAMAVMLLVHDGKLRYDQPLTDIFPGFPDASRSASIRICWVCRTVRIVSGPARSAGRRKSGAARGSPSYERSA